MTDIVHCARELAEIAEYEQGPATEDLAFVGAMWRADWLAEMRLLCEEAKEQNA